MALKLNYFVYHPGEQAAGLRSYTEDITVTIDSGDPGGDSGEFAQELRGFLAEWFDGATVTFWPDGGQHPASQDDEEWKPYPDRGGYYALIGGVLYVVPMLANGLMDASDPLEVDFDAIGAEDAAACRRIEAELAS